MKTTGKYELEMPVSIEFEIASAPPPVGKQTAQINPTALLLQMRVNARKTMKLARTIKKDTKLLLRTLDKMKRHGWLVVDQTDCRQGAQHIKKLILDSGILCDICGESTDSYCAEALADYLVANGIKTDGEEDAKQ